MIRKLWDLELEASVTGTKKEILTKSFLNLEKRRAIQNQIRTLVVNGKPVKKQTEIDKNLHSFYQNLYSQISIFRSILKTHPSH